MKIYLKKNVIPIFAEAMFLISCLTVPSEYYLYTNFLFYLSLYLYFIVTKSFSFRKWKESLKSGKKYWNSVLLTVGSLALAFGVTSVLKNCFPALDAGDIFLRIDSWHKLVLFALSTIVFPSVTEEIFFRKNMIALGSKGVIAVTAILSMFLYALEHSLTMWGIFLTMIWAVPLSVSYIKTKNIYVTMTAHFIVNLLFNGTDAVFMLISMLP